MLRSSREIAKIKLAQAVAGRGRMRAQRILAAREGFAAGSIPFCKPKDPPVATPARTWRRLRCTKERAMRLLATSSGSWNESRCARSAPGSAAIRMRMRTPHCSTDLRIEISRRAQMGTSPTRAHPVSANESPSAGRRSAYWRAAGAPANLPSLMTAFSILRRRSGGASPVRSREATGAARCNPRDMRNL